MLLVKGRIGLHKCTKQYFKIAILIRLQIITRRRLAVIFADVLKFASRIQKRKMKKATVVSMVLSAAFACHAQDSLSEKNLDEIIIYSNKFAERKQHIVQKTEVISAQRIAQVNAQNTGDLLMNTGNIFVQRSQQGGSSPVLRGFEASRVLLVVDGIRMNNAIYRSGHLQNVITVDQNSLERVEVLYGPASTLYGSDALGGAVLLRTKQPLLAQQPEQMRVSGSGFTRYSTANNEKSAHFDFSIGGRRFAWLQAYNYSDFGDTKMGRHYPDKYPDFGRRTFYITTINGIDSIVQNKDDRVQRFSGYSQWDVTQKFLFQPNEKVSHGLNLQLSNSSNVPRYDRLQDVRNGILRFAEWYYGPQLRTLAAYELNVKRSGFFNEIRSIISYQHLKESRHQREYRRYDRLDVRTETLGVWAATADGRKVWQQHELTVGVDAQLNDVASRAIRKNIQTGAVSKLDTRYPDGNNHMNYFGVYAQHLLKFGKGQWVLNDGIRLQYTTLRATINDNSFFNFPFKDIKQNNSAVTGNIGLVFMPERHTRFTAGISSAFRSPNLDDAAKIFESNTASRQLIVPNPGIRPEYTYSADLGFSKEVLNQFRIEATGFYTIFQNAIALAPFQLNGQDSVDYNGIVSKVFAPQNVNKAFLYGFNAALTFDVTKALRFNSTLNYTYGRLKNESQDNVPLDHIPPLYGRTGFSFTHTRFQAEAYALYNGWKKIEDYNPSGEDNAQYATPDGTPAWMTFNVKTTISVTTYLSIQAGIENLLDRNYRYFASGFSAPGRNFIVALRSNF
jgi:hemoglobin/transferrin/lactoferrin receptor protein